MKEIPSNKFEHALNNWIAFVCKRAVVMLIFTFCASLLIFYYTISNLSINTDTSNMLSSDLTFRQNSIEISKSFPQFSDNIIIVLDGPNTDLVNEATNLFSIQLKNDANLYGEIFDPESMEFFKKNGLLYYTISNLEELSDKLITAQPFISSLWLDPSLSTLFNLLDLFLKDGHKNPELMNIAVPIFKNISDVIIALHKNTPNKLPWKNFFSNQSPHSLKKMTTRIIVIKPNTNFDTLEPGKSVINKLRNLGQTMRLEEKYNTRLRLTGSIPLANEELQSVVDGLGIAGILSLVLVAVLLFWALKSGRLVFAVIFTLCCGLVWTAGLATLVIGTLNLISVAFAVLFIGLSVDFGIHFSLCYSKLFRESGENIISLHKTTKKIGGALALTTIAASIGFYSFLPTDYIGLAELGFIAGSGMFIALFTNLTILPAFISLMPPKRIGVKDVKSDNGLYFFKPYKNYILVTAGILTIYCFYVVPSVSFDFDPLNLKDSQTESVSTLLNLNKTSNFTPYSIAVLADNLEMAEDLAREAKRLPVVKNTSTIYDLIPSKQDEKILIIDKLAFILGPSLSQKPIQQTSDHNKRYNSILTLKNRIREFSRKYPDYLFIENLQKFDQLLIKLLKTAKLSQALEELERRLLGHLPSELLQLKNSLNAEKITLNNIPVSLYLRQVASNGRARVDITPTGDMRDENQLLNFVRSVKKVAPKATGTPVIILEAGKTVINSFVLALAITITLIIILVISFTYNLRELILILTPLILAALYTITASVILNLPFNFANIIVLPLLFGLGIASSIHLVWADRKKEEDVMSTSTPRAIFFSALTTIGSFGSIALSSHPGTASMGLLLTIALIFSLVCTLIILPALLLAWPKADTK